MQVDHDGKLEGVESSQPVGEAVLPEQASRFMEVTRTDGDKLDLSGCDIDQQARALQARSIAIQVARANFSGENGLELDQAKRSDADLPVWVTEEFHHTRGSGFVVVSLCKGGGIEEIPDQRRSSRSAWKSSTSDPGIVESAR